MVWLTLAKTPLQAALRETQEEVGLVVTEDEVSFFAVASRSSDKGLAHQYIFRVVLDDARLERIVLQQSEIDAYQFMSRDAVLASNEGFAWSIPHWAHHRPGGYVETRIVDGDPTVLCRCVSSPSRACSCKAACHL